MTLHNVFILFGLLCLTPLSAAAEPVSRTQETIDRAYAVQDAAEAYAKKMQLVGTRGRSVLDKLLGEAFMCGFTMVRKDDPPLIFCTRSAPPIPDCAALDLYVFLDWKGGERTFEKLVPELENANVNGVEPVCKLRFKK